MKLAADLVGGLTALGNALGVTAQAVHQWKRAPANRVLAIEAATGGRVSRHILRPDIYPPMRRARG